MSRQSQHWNTTWDHQRRHQAKLTQKLQKIQTLQALLEVWETHYNPDATSATEDHAYIIHLRAKLRSAQNQYEAMRP
jgi:hypothetical protein